MAFYEKGPVRIHYQEAGPGFPLPLAVRHVRTFLKANRPA